MIETLTLNQTAAYLRQHGLSISNPALANGIQQGQYPFGMETGALPLATFRKRDKLLEVLGVAG